MRTTKKPISRRLAQLLAVLMPVLLLGLAWGRPHTVLAALDAVDAKQELMGDDVDGTFSPSGKSAQTFKPTETGTVTRISLYLYPAGPGETITATVELREGLPNGSGTSLGTDTRTFSSAAWHDFFINAPVTKDATYHYLLTFTSTNNSALSQGYKIISPSSPYAGGDHWNWLGSAWETWTDSDTAFRVYLATNQDPTLATNAGLSLNEGATATLANTHLNITDPDGDTITYTIGTAPTNGSLKKGASTLSAGGTFTQADINGGQITYAHSGTETTADSFTFTAADGKGGTIPSTPFTITVNSVNDAPTFTLGSDVTVLEDSAASSTANFLTGASAGEAGQTLTTTVSNNNIGLFSAQPAIDGTGKLTFTPLANAYGTATVTVTVTDNGGTANGGVNSTTKTFNITITAVNDAPSFTKGADPTINEDAGAQTVATWATGISAGPNEGTQTVSFAVTNDNAGLFSTPPAVDSSGKLTYALQPDANGSATVTVRAQDNGGTDNLGSDTSAAQTFTITVSAVNDNPVTAPDTVAPGTSEDSGEIQILTDLIANDKPGPATAIDEISSQTLSIAGAATGTNGTVRFDNGAIYFTPALNFHGNATFTYTVSDSGGATATETVTVPVTPVADTPSVTSAATNEDNPTTTGLVFTRNAADGAEVTHFQVSWSGLLPGTLTKKLDGTPVGNNSYLTVAEAAAGLTFTPNPDANGTYSLTVRAATSGAGAGLSGDATATITVNAVNDKPVGGADTWSAINEDSGQVSIPFAFLLANDKPGPDTATDETSQTLDIVGVTVSPAQGAADIVGQNVLFTPAADFHGPATLSYTLQDSGGANVTVTVTVPVTPVADTPSVTGATTDEDVASTTGLVFTRNAADGAEVTHFQVSWSGLLPGTLTKKLDGTPVGNNSYLTVAEAAAGLTFTPNPDVNGTYTLTIRAATSGVGAGLSGDATATITVNAINDEPRPGNDSPAVQAEDTGVPWLIPLSELIGNDKPGPDTATDEAGQTLTVVTVTTDPLNGNVTISGGNVVFTPTVHFNGKASFTYTVQDDGLAPNTATATASFTVTAVNDAPVAAPDVLSAVNEDSGVRTIPIADLLANDKPGPVGATDENGQTLTMASVTPVSGGSVKIEGANVLFTLAADFAETAEFRYTVEDNGTPVENHTATVTFPVNGVAEVPTVTTAATREGELSTERVIISPAAADGAAVTHFKITGITNGSLYLSDGLTQIANNDPITATDGAAGLRFRPVPFLNTPYGGTFEFTVQAMLDEAGTGISPSTKAVITVREVNTAPSATPDSGAEIAEDSGANPFFAATLLANDSKGDLYESAQTLTITAVDLAEHGLVDLDGAGNVLFTPDADYYGPASFVYTVTDNGTTEGAPKALSATARVDFTITPVPDAPRITPAPTNEDDETTVVIRPNSADASGVTHFVVTGVTGGTLYKGATPLAPTNMITAAEGLAGLRFVPEADANSVDDGPNYFTVSFKAHDSVRTLTGPESTATIAVSEENDEPIANPDTADAVDEDSGDVIIPLATLIANDDKGKPNESGQTLTIESVTAVKGGTVKIDDAKINAIFTLEADFFGKAEFTYLVKDNGTTNGAPAALPATGTVSIPVNARVDVPSISPASTAEEVQSSTGLVITRHPKDGAEVAQYWIDNITNGTLHTAAGRPVPEQSYVTYDEGTNGLRFTPDKDLNSPANHTFSFTVQAATASGADKSATAATATITVSAVNDPPVGVPDSAPTVTEDSGPWNIPFTTLTANDDRGASDEAGQTLVVTGVTAVSGGSVVPTGTDVIFTPNPDFNGTAEFTYTFKDLGTTNGNLDEQPATDSVTVTFTVTADNDAPVVAGETLTTVAEDSTLPDIPFADLLANDQPGPATATDEAGQILMITEVSGATGGTAVIPPGSTYVRFTLTPNFSGRAGFTYTVEDNGTPARSRTARAEFEVTGVAEAPGVTPNIITSEGVLSPSIFITPDAADAGSVTHFKVTNIHGGTLFHGSTPVGAGFITAAQGADGLTFMPEGDKNTPAGNTFGFDVQASLDGAGGGISPVTPVAITVRELNDPPVAGDDLAADIAEDAGETTIAAATLLANDRPAPVGVENESNQTLTITDAGNAQHGTVRVLNGNVLFTPEADYTGPASFEYTVTDNGTNGGADAALSDTAKVEFTITPVPDAPQVSVAPILEDTQATVVIARSDKDGAEITHFEITGIHGGTVTKKDGTPLAVTNLVTAAEAAEGLKFTPPADDNNQAGDTFSIAVAAHDSVRGLTSPAATVAIVVSEVNDVPVANDDAADAVTEDFGDVTIPLSTLIANDTKGAENEGGQTLTVTDVTAVKGGSVKIDDAKVNAVFTVDANFHGTAEFTYTVTDDGTPVAESDTAMVRIPVTPVADTPSITPKVTAEETQITGLVITRSAVDGAEVTHFLISAPTGGRLFKPDNTEITQPVYLTAAEAGAGLKFTPDADLNSPAGNAFGFTARAALDAAGAGISPTAAAQITVYEVNDRPTGVDDTLGARVEDSGPWTIPVASLLANDLVGPNENGQTLHVSAVSGEVGSDGNPLPNAVGGTVQIVGTDVVFTPDPYFNGPASFTYQLTDNGTTNAAAAPESHTAVARFTVTEVNNAPVGTDDTLPDEAEDSGPWTIPVATLLGNDKPGPSAATNEAGQTLKVTEVGNPVNGTVTLSDSKTDVIFTPTLNFNGAASFTYTVEDNGTTNGVDAPLTTTATARLTVTPVNDAPVAEDKVLSVTVGHTLSGTVSATDVEANPLTYAVVGAPTKGTVTMTAAGAFTYRGTQVGTDTFTYKANDGTADSNVATVTITVTEVPFVPVLTISVPVTETRESSIQVSGTANAGYFVAVNGTTVRADAQGNWSTTVALVEGPNTITASLAGLTRSVTVVRDTIPPVIELTTPDTRTDRERVVLTATSEQGARIMIEGQEVSTLVVTLKMGINRFTATATDRVGNTASTTLTVTRVGYDPKPIEVPVEQGQPGEATMQYFRVTLPGESAPEPLLLKILAPTADTTAVELARNAAEVMGSGDAEAATQADGAPVSKLKATVTFTYDPAAVSNPKSLRIYYFDPKYKVWVEVGGTVDTKANTLTVQVEHFTTFAAMVPQVETPVLDELPAAVETDRLTVTGTFTPQTPVTLVVGGEAQKTVMTDKAGRFTLTGTLAEGRNWLYVKGTGVLASREASVTYLPEVIYTDIGGHWAEQTIERLAKLRIATVYPAPLFQPEARVTRLEFAVMVARSLRLTPVNEAPAFTDTDAMPEWSRPEVAAAVKAGIIKGMPDGSFAPTNLVTRAEMAIMLTRALNYAGKDITPGNKQFSDDAQIPTWARDQVLTAARYGLITGYPDGSFQAANTTTRAEAVTMLSRLVDALNR